MGGGQNKKENIERDCFQFVLPSILGEKGEESSSSIYFVYLSSWSRKPRKKLGKSFNTHLVRVACFLSFWELQRGQQ